MKKGIHALMFGIIVANIILYKFNFISKLDFQQMLFIYPCIWVVLLTGDYDHEKK